MESLIQIIVEDMAKVYIHLLQLIFMVILYC